MASNDEAFDLETGEVITTTPTLVSGALAQLNASEIDRQIATAKAYPRELAKVRKEIYELVVLNEDVAASMTYALPRGKEKNESTGRWEIKIVKGPTARFAEIVAYGWGNNRYGARIIDEGDTHITAQGTFFDLQKNIGVTVEIQRRITDKDGRRYNADMVGMTANAALSVASRNAILKAIPKAWWGDLLEAAEKTVRGKIETLTDRRAKLLEQFKPFGMTAPMVCSVLGVGGVSEITIDGLSMLQGVLTALKDGEVTVEALMSDNVGDVAVAAKGKATVENIKKKYQSVGHGSIGATGPDPANQQARTDLREAQAKLDEKRKQASKNEPAKAGDVVQEGLPMGEEKW